jgi:hypothetical protein
MYTDQLFTGQREMAGLGIYHFGARFLRSAPEAQRRGFSPYINRFSCMDILLKPPGKPGRLFSQS